MSHVILTSVWGDTDRYAHLSDEATEAGENNLPLVTELAGGNNGTLSQVFSF